MKSKVQEREATELEKSFGAEEVNIRKRSDQKQNNKKECI